MPSWIRRALLPLQVVGALLILWNGIPMYRELMLTPGVRRADAHVVAWACVGMLLIQVGYWCGRRWPAAAPARSRPLLGHLVMFAGRLVFTVVTGMFATMFVVRIEHVEFSPVRTPLLFAVLFSLFCFTLEIERRGRALVDTR